MFLDVVLTPYTDMHVRICRIVLYYSKINQCNLQKHCFYWWV